MSQYGAEEFCQEYYFHLITALGLGRRNRRCKISKVKGIMSTKRKHIICVPDAPFYFNVLASYFFPFPLVYANFLTFLQLFYPTEQQEDNSEL